MSEFDDGLDLSSLLTSDFDENDEKNDENVDEKEEEEKNIEAVEDSNFETSDVRIAMIGNVDSGKSTLIGVLTTGSLDDGRGSARSQVLQYGHERETGRTSSVSIDIVGYDENGEQIISNKRNHLQRWNDVIQQADRTLTLIDLCGHEKYLKTTVFGLTGMFPDYGVLLLGANMGVQRMTLEHIAIACALEIPFFICVTKIDIAPIKVLKQTRKTMARFLRKNGKMPYPVKSEESVQTALESINSGRVIPVFAISCVTGSGMDLLKSFLKQLRRYHASLLNRAGLPLELQTPTTTATTTTSDSNELNINEIDYSWPNPSLFFQLDSVYDVRGVGIVIGGTCLRGRITTNQVLKLGPSPSNTFVKVLVRSIECRRKKVDVIKQGQAATLAIRVVSRRDGPLRRNNFRKSMVLIDEHDDARSAWEFEASVLILHHQTTIAPGYQPVIHCGVVRQSASIIEIVGKDVLRTDERARVRFRFNYRPEYILPGVSFLFREGAAKGLGKIVKVFPSNEVEQSEKKGKGKSNNNNNNNNSNNTNDSNSNNNKKNNKKNGRK